MAEPNVTAPEAATGGFDAATPTEPSFEARYDELAAEIEADCNGRIFNLARRLAHELSAEQRRREILNRYKEEYLRSERVRAVIDADPEIPAAALATSWGDRYSYEDTRRAIDAHLRWAFEERRLKAREGGHGDDEPGSFAPFPLEEIAAGVEDGADQWGDTKEYLSTIAAELVETKHRLALLEDATEMRLHMLESLLCTQASAALGGLDPEALRP